MAQELFEDQHASGVEDVEEESVICGKCRTKLNKERDIAVTDDPAVQSTDHDIVQLY